ncbi:tRNA G46 methylase TrmB [Micromonospora luteifusca]|uniref:tRNA G46 methylase TrmB n=1 Tax=Micromonospora luteifusca TaxID=709860 RepID=A0ABS2LL89_9ACTN|nr:class I SAM-dependent methyltransferase [Micromonospora luteifusca]MBM7488941.1 tRNA G46 methylase TrmB [Micromonospora luteifusca]
MRDANREVLRTTFGQDAELYDQCRPTYPPQLFTDLATLAGLGRHARVLEIGCGTGQATLPLAGRTPSSTTHNDATNASIRQHRPACA